MCELSEATKYTARVKRIAGTLGVSSRFTHGEDHVGIEVWK